MPSLVTASTPAPRQARARAHQQSVLLYHEDACRLFALQRVLERSASDLFREGLRALVRRYRALLDRLKESDVKG